MEMDYKNIIQVVRKRLESAHDTKRKHVRKGFFELEYNFFRKHIRNQKVLVAGAGLGHDSIEIAKDNKKVVGIELITPYIKIAKDKVKKLNLKNIEFKQGDFRSLSYPDNSFDSIVLNMGTLSDFKNKEEIIKEFLRVAKKVYFDFYPPTKEGLKKRKKMYEEENWKNVRIKNDIIISDDGLYSESTSKKEIRDLVKNIGAKVILYDFCDFSVMAEVGRL